MEVNWSAKEPPICTAVPSRPTDAPNKCEITVLPRIMGAMRKGTVWIGALISSISRLWPASTDCPHFR